MNWLTLDSSNDSTRYLILTISGLRSDTQASVLPAIADNLEKYPVGKQIDEHLKGYIVATSLLLGSTLVRSSDGAH